MNEKKNTPLSANLLAVWNTISNHAPLTVDDIIVRTGLSRPTVLSFLEELTGNRLVTKSGYAKSSGGRQPAFYSPDPHAGYTVGIDIDFPTFHINISDFTGNIVYSSANKTDILFNSNEVIQALYSLYDSAIEDSGVPLDLLLGCGIGFPGFVKKETNMAIKSSRLIGWKNIPLGQLMTEKTGVPCWVRNNAHMLGVGERFLLEEKPADLLYFNNSYTLEMAVFINGKLYEGSLGNAGYIGHTTLDKDGPLCECGQRGCAELYCSRTAIEKAYAAIRWSSSRSCAPYEKILRLANTVGDEGAIDILRNAGDLYGELIASTMKLFDIPTIILGGMGNNTDCLFFQSVAQSVHTHCGTFFGGQEKVLPSKITDKNAALGVCRYIIDNLSANPEALFFRNREQV